MGNKVFIATDGSNSSLPDEVQKHVSEMFRSNDRSSEKVVLGLELEHSALELSSGSELLNSCLLYTSPSPRDQRGSRMPSSA